MSVDLIFEEQLHFIVTAGKLVGDLLKKNRIVSEKYVHYVINEDKILIEFNSYHKTIFIAKDLKTNFLTKVNKTHLYGELRRLYRTYYSMDETLIYISNRFWTQYQTDMILQRYLLENTHIGE